MGPVNSDMILKLPYLLSLICPTVYPFLFGLGYNRIRELGAGLYITGLSMGPDSVHQTNVSPRVL